MNNITDLLHNQLINILGVSKQDIINSIVNKNKNISDKQLIKEINKLLINERNLFIYIQRQNGLTYKEIAEYHKLTIERVRQILVDTNRKLKLITLKVKGI